MEHEKCAHHDDHFQEELKSLKVNMAHIVSLLEQALRNTSGDGPSNQFVTFVQTQTITQPKERIGEHGKIPNMI